MSDRKTAEARAKEVVARGFETRAIADWGIDDPDHIERLVAAAIREAEDDALERAARIAEQERNSQDGRSDPAWCAADTIATEIRGLKSKETER